MKTMIVILSALILLTQAAAGADRPERELRWNSSRGPADGWMMVGRDSPYSAAWLDEVGLNLTADQDDRLRTLDEKWMRQVEPLQDRMRETGKALKSEWLKLEPDRRRTEALQGEVFRLREQMREMRAGRRAEALKVLTAEQRSRLEETEQRRSVRHDRVRYRQNWFLPNSKQGR